MHQGHRGLRQRQRLQGLSQRLQGLSQRFQGLRQPHQGLRQRHQGLRQRHRGLRQGPCQFSHQHLVCLQVQLQSVVSRPSPLEELFRRQGLVLTASPTSAVNLTFACSSSPSP